MPSQDQTGKQVAPLSAQHWQLSVRRARAMARLRARGWTLSRIGAKYGVTRQRVHKILLSHAKDVADLLPRSEAA